MKWGGGISTATAGSTGITQANWGTHGKATVETSDYADRNNKLTAFEVGTQKLLENADNILKATEADKEAVVPITLAKNALYDNMPAADTTITKPQLQALHSLLHGPTSGADDDDKMKKERADHLLFRLKINKTACEIGAQPNSKQTCEVNTELPKCDNNDQSECGKTSGCEWNKIEGKCKLTEKAQKEAEKANKQTAGKDRKTTNTTGSNYFVVKASPLLLEFLLYNQILGFFLNFIKYMKYYSFKKFSKI
uniref:Variant surface glycoprotein 1125.5775 n=1 Tax=Trypanosoma brucei TaxID=5691 RepID=A0A1J0RDD3_9TRYP|nr:variant surface glycoprotein 1125.5775 [Trypanosoma brucei]